MSGGSTNGKPSAVVLWAWPGAAAAQTASAAALHRVRISCGPGSSRISVSLALRPAFRLFVPENSDKVILHLILQRFENVHLQYNHYWSFKNEKPRLVNLREWDFVRIAETHRIEGKPELCLEISQCQGASACLGGVRGVSREGPSEKSQPGRKQEWESKAEGRRGLCRAWCSSARGLMQERPHVPRHPATRARCHWPR